VAADAEDPACRADAEDAARAADAEDASGAADAQDAAGAEQAADGEEAEPAPEVEPAHQLPLPSAFIHLQMIGRFILGALAFLIIGYSAWFIAWYSGTQSGNGSTLPAPPYAGVISDMSK
jgi:hypothetical protein